MQFALFVPDLGIRLRLGVIETFERELVQVRIPVLAKNPFPPMMDFARANFGSLLRAVIRSAGRREPWSCLAMAERSKNRTMQVKGRVPAYWLMREAKGGDATCLVQLARLPRDRIKVQEYAMMASRRGFFHYWDFRGLDTASQTDFEFVTLQARGGSTSARCELAWVLMTNEEPDVDRAALMLDGARRDIDDVGQPDCYLDIIAGIRAGRLPSGPQLRSGSLGWYFDQRAKEDAEGQYLDALWRMMQRGMDADVHVVEEFRMIGDRKGGCPRAALVAGLLLLMKGQKADAKRYIRRAAEARVMGAGAHFFHHWLSAPIEPALQVSREWLEDDARAGHHDSCAYLGCACAKCGNWREAVRWLRKAARAPAGRRVYEAGGWRLLADRGLGPTARAARESYRITRNGALGFRETALVDDVIKANIAGRGCPVNIEIARAAWLLKKARADNGDRV